ncbi:DUF1345 domain-containing protein [uncultured Hymenobacter sp.]|uniref:DUF1345 domain-containing protein n=1 Tax=uncultured Hymenobacter sp. TaxID=170016 RepID=UPI0035CB9F7E
MSVTMVPITPLRRFIYWLGRLPALGRLAICVSLGVAASFVPTPGLDLLSRVAAAWDAFAWSLLLLSWAAITTADTGRIRDVATSEDPGRLILFGVVLVGIVASLLAVVVLLGTMHSLGRSAFVAQVSLAIGAVAGAWLLLHTSFTLRYAHLYYDPDVDGGEGGLQFPGEPNFEPDYLDFAYFAFTIGMAAQTADVAIAGRTLRQLTLLHSVLSFSFNTALVAMSISALGGAL